MLRRTQFYKIKIDPSYCLEESESSCVKMKSRILADDPIYHVPIAHRGFHDQACPENSLAAFARAAELGYAIELDLHLLADDTLAVFHDYDLKRMTGQEGRITNLDKQDLTSYRLKESDETIPTLEQVFDLIAGRVPLLLEMKRTEENAKAALILKEQIDSYIQKHKGKIWVESFDPHFLLALKEVAPEILRGQLATQGLPIDLEESVKLAQCAYNDLTEPDFIAYYIADPPLDLFEIWRRQGLPIIGWTVKNESQWQQAIKNFDNLIFEGFRPEEISD